MTDWSKKWDEREKNKQPVFDIKILILVGLVVFVGFFIFVGFILPVIHMTITNPCDPFEGEVVVNGDKCNI